MTVWVGCASAIEYTYDSGGSPVWSSETHYLYDGTRVIQERDTNNNPHGQLYPGSRPEQ